MQRDPQVSLNILNNINHEMPAYSKQVRMEYELLLIQALDKTNHSLTKYQTKIDSVLDYFKGNGTVEQCARAYYYKGGYYRDKGDELNAINWYQKAWREVNKKPILPSSEKELASVICAQISSLLYSTSNYAESLKYAILEYKYSSTPIGKFEGACDLARGYKGIADTGNGITDSIAKYYDIAFDLSKRLQLKGPNYQHNLLSQVSFFLDLGMKDKAKERLKFLDIGSFGNDPSGFYVLGVIYDGIGKTDSALYYYHKATECKDYGKVRGAYCRLMEHEYKKGNWKAAADYGFKFKEANDSSIKQDDAERVARKLENREASNLAVGYKEIKEELGTQKQDKILLYIVIAGISCGCVWYISYIKREYKSKLSEIQAESRKTKEKLEKEEKESAVKTEKLLKIEPEFAQIKAKVEDLEARERFNLPTVSAFRDEIKQLLVEGRSMSTEMSAQLPKIVAEAVPEAEQKMNEYYSGNPMYSNVLGLFLLGFRNAEIYRLTGNSRANITKYWNKIRIEILGEDYKESPNLISDIRKALSKDATQREKQ